MKNSNRFTFFPAPAEGETPYSLISRYHLMSGHCSFRANTLAMLGVVEGRASNEFPCFLSQLSLAGDIPLTTVIQSMTPYRYYATFLPETLRQLLWDCLATGQTRNIQSSLGAVANRMTPGQLLFSCRHCIKDDIDKYGFPFWHLIHQLTGVVVCPYHHEILHAVPRIKSQAILPEIAIERPATTIEVRYAFLIQNMYNEDSQTFLKQKCLVAYRRRLSEMGLTTALHRIRFQHFRGIIENHLDEVKAENVAFNYLHNQLPKHQFPECLFYQETVNHHPLKHLVIIEALFNSWPEFIAEVNKPYVQQPAPKVMISNHKKSIELTTKAKRLLQSGQSLRAVSKVVGISVTSLKIAAQKAGVYVDCRPSKVFVAIERAIWRLLLIGRKTADIAHKFSISIGAVEQILRKHPKLVELRKKIWFYQRQKHHRDTILVHVDLNPLDTRKLIRQAHGASYIWLYKHDKAWLYNHLPPEVPRSQRYFRTNTKESL